MEGLRTRTKNKLKRFTIPLVDRQLIRNVPGIRAPFVGNLLGKKVLPLVKVQYPSLLTPMSTNSWEVSQEKEEEEEEENKGVEEW